MTKKEKALISETIKELEAAVSEHSDALDILDLESRIDCLHWVLECVGGEPAVL